MTLKREKVVVLHGTLKLGIFVTWKFCNLEVLSLENFGTWKFCNNLGFLYFGNFITGEFVAGNLLLGNFVTDPSVGCVNMTLWY